MTRTILGFQLRVQGSAPRAARFAGFSDKKIIYLSMLVSGGLAGLAGIFEVSGPIGQLTASISPGYGYTAIIVAFLGRLHPLGVVLAGLLLALSYLGGEAAQIDLGLPERRNRDFPGRAPVLPSGLRCPDPFPSFAGRCRASCYPRRTRHAVAEAGRMMLGIK